MKNAIIYTIFFLIVGLMFADYLGSWAVDDYVTFTCNTFDSTTGALSASDNDPNYMIFENETGTPIVSGTMSALNSADTHGLYSERVQLTAASGFELGKHYTVYIQAAVNEVEGAVSHNFQVGLDVKTIRGETPYDVATDTVKIRNIFNDPNFTDVATDASTSATFAAKWLGGGEFKVKMDTVYAGNTTLVNYWADGSKLYNAVVNKYSDPNFVDMNANITTLAEDWADGGRSDVLLDTAAAGGSGATGGGGSAYGN